MTDNTDPTTEERLRLLEDAISNIDYPGSDSEEWTHKALGHARALAGDVAVERARREQAEVDYEEMLDERDGWEKRLDTVIYSLATVEEVGEWSSGNSPDLELIDHIDGKVQRLERERDALQARIDAVKLASTTPEDVDSMQWAAGRDTRLLSLYRRALDRVDAALAGNQPAATPEPHSMKVVDGEIEVCSTCVNPEGNAIAWDQAHPTPEPGGTRRAAELLAERRAKGLTARDVVRPPSIYPEDLPEPPRLNPTDLELGTAVESGGGARWVVRWSAILGFHWSHEDHEPPHLNPEQPGVTWDVYGGNGLRRIYTGIASEDEARELGAAFDKKCWNNDVPVPHFQVKRVQR